MLLLLWQPSADLFTFSEKFALALFFEVMAGFAQLLYSAAEAGDALVVRKLLRRFPNINVNSRGREMFGHTALSKAAKSLSLNITVPDLLSSLLLNVCYKN